MVLPGRVRQVPPPRNRSERVVPRLVSVGSRGIRPADDCDGRGGIYDFVVQWLWLALHRLDAHFCGRLRHRHFRRRCWLATVARCNDNGNHRRNQQRSPAGNYCYPKFHLTIHKASQLNFSAFYSRAYTVKLIQKSPTLLSS